MKSRTSSLQKTIIFLIAAIIQLFAIISTTKKEQKNGRQTLPAFRFHWVNMTWRRTHLTWPNPLIQDMEELCWTGDSSSTLLFVVVHVHRTVHGDLFYIKFRVYRVYLVSFLKHLYIIYTYCLFNCSVNFNTFIWCQLPFIEAGFSQHFFSVYHEITHCLLQQQKLAV